MRSLSACNNRIIFTLLLLALSCATAPPGNRQIEPVHIEGRVVVEGSNPFARSIMLVDSTGACIELANSGLVYELSKLEGYSVRIKLGRNRETEGKRQYEVKEYMLLKIGESFPLKGTLSLEGDSLLISAGGTSAVIEGPLREALTHFTGLEVWVWGERRDVEENAPTVIIAKGYEVLGAPIE